MRFLVFAVFAMMRSTGASGGSHMRRTLACLIVVFTLAGVGIVRPQAGDAAATPHDQTQADTPSARDTAAPPTAPAASPRPQSTTVDTAHGAAAAAATAEPPPSFAETLCKELGWAALDNRLPAEFFTRLIWQESRFDARSVSRAGAQGIAQFMPGTARWRGLADPFEPIQALRESARWLGELREQFGNLGLAAAAYNAGPRRVQDWLDGHGNLPGETRAYVRIITGRTAEEWVKVGNSEEPKPFAAGNVIPCNDIAKILAHSPRPAPVRTAAATDTAKAWGPWGLQLTGNWSEARALAEYRDLQKKYPALLGEREPMVLRGPIAGRGSAPWYRVRVSESSRERAAQLCASLERAGGKCLVFKN
jgi:hypothetical protein